MGLTLKALEKRSTTAKNTLKIITKHKKLAAKKGLGKSISCQESCRHMGQITEKGHGNKTTQMCI